MIFSTISPPDDPEISLGFFEEKAFFRQLFQLFFSDLKSAEKSGIFKAPKITFSRKQFNFNLIW